MIARTDNATVAPVGRVIAPVGAEAVADARQQDFQRALAGLVGKSMPAEVISRLTDGTFLVRVAGTPARMALPAPAQAGSEVALTLVSLTPRPTFQLTSAPQSAAIPAFVDPHAAGAAEAGLYAPAGGMARAAPLQRAAALSGEAAPAGQAAPQSGAAEPVLSATARVISSVLGAAARSEHPQTAIIAPLPLLAAAPTDPAKLATQLKDAIGASGLFYESHVAEWSAGTRPLAELRREPQMQREPQLQREAQAQRDAPIQPAVPGAATPGLSAPAADPATAQFINLQLASQEQGRVAWQGQLLPGQDMTWQISRDAPDAHARPDADSAEPPWRSALRLRFAALGEIGATVVLAGDQLHIQLQANSNEVGSVLRARAGELQRALEASGNPLASLTVAAGDSGHD